jgi:hypothetical protein
MERFSTVILQWYMKYSKKHNEDDHIRSGDLCQMLSTRGVLKPTTEGQPQFSSAIVPVHTLVDAEAGVTAVIRSGMSVALTPPKHFLHPDPTAQEYREYYNSHIAALTSSALERAVLQYRNINPYITNFSTSPCLFPAALRPIVDVAVVNKTDNIRLEGQRMLKIVANALTQKATQQQRDVAKHKNTRNSEHPSPLKQTTVMYKADGQLRLAETQQPRIVSMAQL